MSAATCGMTPLMTTSSRKRCPEPAKSEPTASWIRAPALSSSQMNGMRLVSASSRRRVLALEAAHRVMDAGVDAELGEGALVEQQVEALPGRELVLLVLAGDLLFPAAEAGLRAALVELLH